MSDAFIVRRGGSGNSFSHNGAVLKVVTSVGCSVDVSGTGYNQTHQNADGYPRSDNANVVEHFFSIPASAFGTITVTATNGYGTSTKTLTVNTAGKVYELLIGGPNILLDSTFGKQDGFSIIDNLTTTKATYDSDYKTYTLSNNSSSSTPYRFFFSNSYDVTLYEKIKIKYKNNVSSASSIWSLGYERSRSGGTYTELLSPSTSYSSREFWLADKAKTPFSFFFEGAKGIQTLIVSEIVLS